MADSRRRDVQLLGSFTKTHVPGSGFEGPERIKGG
jgi:hypothetical protein